MKKSYVFDVLFFLLMFGVIACEEEIESLTFSNSVNQETEGVSHAFNDFFFPEKSSDMLIVQEKAQGKSIDFSNNQIYEIILPTPPNPELEEAPVKFYVNKMNRMELRNLDYSVAFQKGNVKMMLLKEELPHPIEEGIVPDKKVKTESIG